MFAKLAPFAKSIVPATLTLVGDFVYSFAAGSFDRQSIVIAAVGLGGAVVTYFVPNAEPEVQALENVFAVPGNYTPVSALNPEPAPTVPLKPVLVSDASPEPPTTPPAAA